MKKWLCPLEDTIVDKLLIHVKEVKHVCQVQFTQPMAFSLTQVIWQKWPKKVLRCLLSLGFHCFSTDNNSHPYNVYFFSCISKSLVHFMTARLMFFQPGHTTALHHCYSIWTADFTVDLHSAGCSSISSIAGVYPRVTDMTLHDLKKPFPSHCINAQVFAWLQLRAILKRCKKNKNKKTRSFQLIKYN